jgi:hypothetical protein
MTANRHSAIECQRWSDFTSISLPGVSQFNDGASRVFIMQPIRQCFSRIVGHRAERRRRVMSGVGQPQGTNIVQKELSLFLRTAEQSGLDGEHLRRFLRISREDWEQWLAVIQDDKLPPTPALPLLLRHLGHLTSRLDRAARSARALASDSRLPNAGGRARVGADGTEQEQSRVAAAA